MNGPIPVGVKELFEKTENLSLISLEESSFNIFPYLGSRGFNALVSRSVKHCHEFEYIADGPIQCKVFGYLHFLIWKPCI